VYRLLARRFCGVVAVVIIVPDRAMSENGIFTTSACVRVPSNREVPRWPTSARSACQAPGAHKTRAVKHPYMVAGASMGIAMHDPTNYGKYTISAISFACSVVKPRWRRYTESVVTLVPYHKKLEWLELL
jgi:hypothetical protein